MGAMTDPHESSALVPRLARNHCRVSGFSKRTGTFLKSSLSRSSHRESRLGGGEGLDFRNVPVVAKFGGR